MDTANNNNIILVIEHESEAFPSTEDAISGFGYKIIRARSGDEAVTVLSDNVIINLIIMEIDLGSGMDGAETARNILSRVNIPIIFYTAHTEKEYIEKVRDIPHYGYVVKSSGIYVLQSSIETALRFFDTEKKSDLLNKSFRNYEEKYKMMITYSPYGIAQLDADGILKECNDAFVEMTGSTRELIIGYNTLELLDVKMVSAVKTALKGEVSFYEDTYQSITVKKSTPVRMHFAPLKNLNGDMLGVLLIAEDITEWTKLQDSLNEDRELFSQAFKMHKSIMLMIDSVNGKILNANEAASKFYGYDSDLLCRMSIFQINMLPPDEIQTEMKRAITEERNYYIFPHKLASGEIRTVEVYSSPVMIKGKSVLFSIIHDISERRKMENKVKALLEENEIILREVHHRIKNNMSAIKGLLELQMDTLEDPLTVSALKAAESRIQSMIVLYEKLHMTRYSREVGIKEYFSDLVDEIINLFPNSNCVVIRKEIEDFTLGQNKLFLIGIIINELLTNIMKYAFSNYEKGVIVFKSMVKENNVIIEVSDSGRGLPASFNLNEPKGFGLQVVTMLIGQLHGSISAENSNGTKFILLFPQQ